TRTARGSVARSGLTLAREYHNRVDNLPLVRRYFESERHASSNEWAVSGEHTITGSALVANDPHLALGIPSVWYPNHLRAGSLDVIGNSFAGIPFVVLGHNRRIAWGATKNPMDVTDVYQEQVVVDLSSPSHLS